MIRTFLALGFKNYFRSPVWGKSLAANIILSLLALMMLFYVLLGGLFLPELVQRLVPNSAPQKVISGIVLYYFGIEFMLRFFLQNTPVLFIQPFLHLPLKKGKIIHFMLRKSLFSAFNLLALLLFFPYIVIHLVPYLGLSSSSGWFLGILGLVFLNHYLGIYVKKKLSESSNSIIVILGSILVLVGLEYFNIVKFSDISVAIIHQLMLHPYLATIPFILAYFAYSANYSFLFRNTYPEELSTKEKSANIQGDFGFLKKFGATGELIALELKLILRHKRPKTLLIMSGFLLLYGLIFYPQEEYQQMPFIFVFVGIFITGLFFINHGQFMLSWQGGHFDFILTRKGGIEEYLKAKYWMYVATCFAAFVLSLAYVFFGWKIALINLSSFLFNVGVNIPLVMYISMFNPKKIDLTKGAAFNYQGVGAAQWLMALPVILLPYLFFLPLYLFGYEILGILLVGLIGVVGFLLREKALNKLTERLSLTRHKIAAGFRAQ